MLPSEAGAVLVPGVRIRLLQRNDASNMSTAYLRNRDHLSAWEPERDDAFFTPDRQLNIIQAKLAQHSVGGEVPWVLVDDDDPAYVIGAITLTGIVRGPFVSANLGYWVDSCRTRRGIGSAGNRDCVFSLRLSWP